MINYYSNTVTLNDTFLNDPNNVQCYLYKDYHLLTELRELFYYLTTVFIADLKYPL